MEIPYAMSNVAETSVAPINADATLSAGGAGNHLMFAGVVIAQKGTPFEAIPVNKDNYLKKLGKPYHPSKGEAAEPVRHVADALETGGTGLVVRVVPDDAKYPLIRIASKDGRAFTAKADALPFATKPTLDDGENEKLAIYVIDGETSGDRAIEIKVADANIYGEGMYELILSQKDTAGNYAELEKYFVSLDPEATDDMGVPAYIETVLEEGSRILRAVVAPEATTLAAIAKTPFAGGTAGTLSTISSANYQKALAVLNASVIRFTHVLGLGCYEEHVIKELISIANRRRIGGFFDVNPRLSFTAACEAKEGLGINAHRACFYHLPFDCKDPTYKCRAIWGLSGVAFAAKATGVAKTAPTGGWHYTPAGDRALIMRTGLRQLPNAGEPDYERMYRCRLNKVSTNQAGYLFIDDSLTSYVRENYLRFEQIVSVTDAISRDFHVLSNSLKHQPDGVTYDGLVEGMTRILDGYVSTGALVPPTDKSDGEEPYKLIVEKADKDAWRIRWAISVTGSGRRFLGEPVLIK